MLREKTQRRLSRLLFVLGCVAPTLAIGGLALAQMTPIYRSVVLCCVGDAAGVKLTAASLRTPTPGVYVVEELRVANETGDRTIARCDRLRVRRAADGWSVEAGAVWIDTEAATSTRWRAQRSGGVSLLVKADELIASNEDDEVLVRWRKVAVQTTPSENGGFTLSALAGAPDEPEACRLRVAQEKRDAPIHLAFDTGVTELRGALLPKNATPELIRGAVFRGAGELTINGKAHRGEIHGELAFGPTGPTATRGFAAWETASLRLAEARWWGPVVTNLKAELAIESGSLDRTLVWGLNQRLGCGATASLRRVYETTAGDHIPLDRLVCRVALDAHGVEIRSGEDGVLATLDGEPLLLEPAGGRAPLTAIVQALWPFLTPELPATAEAREVARRLPLRSASAEPAPSVQ